MLNPIRWLPWGFRWVRKMAAMLRELRTHEQHILSARDLIAAELRHNARVREEMGPGPFGWEKLRKTLSLARWHQYGGELSILRKRHPELWADLVAMYERLQIAAESFSPKISAEELTDLAKRLSDAEL